MQTRGIEMSQLYTLVRDTTKLTDVQAKILDHMQVALQLASDISRNQVYLCARGKNDDISVILMRLSHLILMDLPSLNPEIPV